MQSKSQWTHNELPKGWHHARVWPTGDGWWMFRAIPDRGDMCAEGFFKEEAAALKAADDWIADRESPERAKIYCSSY